MNSGILVVVPSRSSFNAFFRELAAETASCGLRFAVACGPSLHPQSEPSSGGTEVLSLPSFRSGDPLRIARAALVLRTIVNCWRPAIVHAHFATAALIAAIAKGLRAGPRTTWLATFHGLSGTPGAGEPAHAMLAAAEAWSARRMSLSFVLNDEDYAHLRVRNPQGNTVRQPGFGLGCDLPSFDARRFGPEDKLRIRRTFGLKAAGPVLAFIGRRTAFKGFPQTLVAFQGVRARIPGAKLIVAGEPDVLHGGDAAVATASSQPGVIDAGWTNDVASVLAVADLCILPSVREGMPVSLMEALAMGVPCITMDTRGCRDVVRDQVDGIVLQTRDPKVLAASIVSLLQQPARLAAMARAAADGRSRFDRARHVAYQIAVYRGLLAGEDAAPLDRPAET